MSTSLYESIKRGNYDNTTNYHGCRKGGKGTLNDYIYWIIYKNLADFAHYIKKEKTLTAYSLHEIFLALLMAEYSIGQFLSKMTHLENLCHFNNMDIIEQLFEHTIKKCDNQGFNTLLNMFIHIVNNLNCPKHKRILEVIKYSNMVPIGAYIPFVKEDDIPLPVIPTATMISPLFSIYNADDVDDDPPDLVDRDGNIIHFIYYNGEYICVDEIDEMVD